MKDFSLFSFILGAAGGAAVGYAHGHRDERATPGACAGHVSEVMPCSNVTSKRSAGSSFAS